MFNKKITMEEFAHGVYFAGIARYNHFLDYFKEQEIKINTEKMIFVTGLINERIFEKILKDENIKIEGNLLDAIIEELNITVPEGISPKGREKVLNYIQKVNKDIQEIMNKENSKISDTIDYFLKEITYEPISKDKNIENEFTKWEQECKDLIKKFKLN